jgi:enolase
MTTITDVEAWEVLDSRGNPTVAVSVEAKAAVGRFLVPAGASTGQYEAVERRDGENRYRGMGVSDAVQSVHDDLAPVVDGMDVTDQAAIDTALVECDGTDALSRLGANAVLGVSGAVAHAASAAAERPLYETVADGGPGSVPVPMVNILSGGLHAEGGIEIQDYLVIPLGRDSVAEAIHDVWAVRQAVRDRIVEAGHRPLVADEGGFAPPLDDIDAAFDLLVAAIEDAGFSAAQDDVAIAIDVAAAHFYDGTDETYRLDSLDVTHTPDEMVEAVCGWIDAYPIVSVEDPLDETDWAHWRALADRVGDRVQLLGDDLIATNEGRLERALDTDTANAVLVKPNQAGTLTRAVNVTRRAQTNDAAPVVSARSGETCDATIVDLAVGLDAGQIKIGSLARSERLAKYNRLLELESRFDVPYASEGVLSPL